MHPPLIEIVPFELSHQPGIDRLYKSVQEEYGENIFTDPSKTITYLSQLPRRFYWVALSDEQLIGTVGIAILPGNYCALKGMFLAKEFRGDKREIAVQLLQTAIDNAIRNECTKMFLGTMEQFKGAQRFYEKHGFTEIKAENLPDEFPANAVDTVFYYKNL